jgi:hypothetical protein
MRLHRAVYIHGNPTPYNFFLTGLEPPQFVFIDYEHVRSTFLSRFDGRGCAVSLNRDMSNSAALKYGSDARVVRLLGRVFRAAPADGTTWRCSDASARSGAETRTGGGVGSRVVGQHREARGR